MVRRTISSTIFILSLALLGSQPAQANTPLTRAVVSSLRNQVRLLPNRKPARKAKLSDVLRPGDGIVTSRRSLAELRFNDGSLARMGEQAVFRFIPKTRSFRLSNGTVLMLIPPGQGRTQVRTPNVTAGIRGSALMIRYDKVTDTSTVIALTNSQISVTNREQSQTQVLAAGQAVVTVGNKIVDSYDVDLQELYRTSDLLKDLEMNNPDAEVKDEAIAQVREETLEGIQSQRSFALGEGRDGTEEFRLSELNIDSVIADETGRPFGTALPGVESVNFPGRSIGVDGRFNEDNGGELAVPNVPQPAATEPPVPTIVRDPEPIEELPQVVETPVVVEPPPLAPPNIVDSPEVEPPAIENPDTLFPQDPVSDNPGDAIEDLPGDDIAGGNDIPGDAPIAEVDDLPADIPVFGDDTGALAPLEPGDGGDIALPDIDEPSGGDDLPGINDDHPDINTPDIVGGDDIPGGDDPISDVDDLPAEIPVFGEDTGALAPLEPGGGGDIALPDIGEPSGGDDLPGINDDHPDINTPDIVGGDDIPGGDNIPGGDDPISDVDDLPAEIPVFGEDTGALAPLEPGDGGDIALPDTGEPSGGDDLPGISDDHPDINTPDTDSVELSDSDITVDFTITVTVDGDKQEFTEVAPNVFQGSTASDATVEPTPVEDISAGGA